ncbi:hypothetical protein CEXT_570261 [Caerostris extrusa]|uniref:Antifreeze protein n=1 Tax=Caerostris extrusa TaxID=172846 RepID=A0AAV4W723_CAEEX|nr:hypothetical protein CEXT_570261 [Caerostris extrusa]
MLCLPLQAARTGFSHTHDRPHKCTECGKLTLAGCANTSASATLMTGPINVRNVVNALLTLAGCANTSASATLMTGPINVRNVVNALLTLAGCANTSASATLMTGPINVRNVNALLTLAG